MYFDQVEMNTPMFLEVYYVLSEDFRGHLVCCLGCLGSMWKVSTHNHLVWLLSRFWREPISLLFFVNIPSIILKPDKYNTFDDINLR